MPCVPDQRVVLQIIRVGLPRRGYDRSRVRHEKHRDEEEVVSRSL